MAPRRTIKKGEAGEQEAKERLAGFQSKPLDDTVPVSDRTTYKRGYAMWLFKEYVRDVLHREPDDTWLSLCSSSPVEVALAQDTCRAFLQTYVSDSSVSRVALGDQESEEVRQVNRVSSVLTVWRALVQEGDEAVLAPKRRENRHAARQWRLVNPSGKLISGPVWEVSNWIVHDLPLLTGISNELKRQKRAATAQDIVVIMQALLNRHRDILHSTAQLSDFAMIVLCMAIGGFRTNCPRNLKYADVRIGLANVGGKTNAFVRIRMPENKLRVASLKPASPGREFAVAILPCRLVCLASHVIGRALARRAFRAGYTSFDQVLTWPNLRGCKVLFLPWAQGLGDLPFVDISGSQFYRIWYRCCEVAGMEDPPIPYSMRVGSGGKIIGILGELLGNWMLMHKSNTHQEYYFPDYVSQNLARVTLGVLAPPEDALFSLLSDLSSTADPFAPCHLSEEEFKKLLERRDVQALQDHKTGQRNLLDQLSYLAIREKREKYFRNMEDARALGGNITITESQISNSDVIVDATPVDEEGRASFIELLASYSRLLKRSKKNDPNRNVPDLCPRSICVLCDPTGKALSFSQHSSLTRHYRIIHLRHGHLDEMRECPVPGCGLAIDAGVSPFYCHLERQHGKYYTPAAHRHIERSICVLCDPTGRRLSFSQRQNLTAHFKADHLPLGHLDQARQCPVPACGSKIQAGIQPFCDHLQRTHGKHYTPHLCNNGLKQREHHRSYRRVQPTSEFQKKSAVAIRAKRKAVDDIGRPDFDLLEQTLQDEIFAVDSDEDPVAKKRKQNVVADY
ncbi:hypothetical protein P152DRAFT_347678 [Eremomyces bilateralis CBS 781.70]|uniref:Uncharacterized protein n=1 Tax=Eremomyces bilateralis CBS 781.70 TaxID=1392243 RepID=A0A6G1G3P8_9PEZI|nr:uncharacterized protein P152DRAFT_347678 [Eremomyces bilateralis CBS 781.70]KAF1812725.1 hypothetical protein P152DRAFT_347678 [Eremomyces bilateralis CBS 781.70]